MLRGIRVEVSQLRAHIELCVSTESTKISDLKLGFAFELHNHRGQERRANSKEPATWADPRPSSNVFHYGSYVGQGLPVPSTRSFAISWRA